MYVNKELGTSESNPQLAETEIPAYYGPDF